MRHLIRLLFATMLLLCFAQAQSAIPLLYPPLTPTATQPGAADLKLTVRETGFLTGAVVLWNGTPRPTTYVSDSLVTAMISSADLVIPGTAPVTVRNPSTTPVSNELLFPVSGEADTQIFSESSYASGSSPRTALARDFNADGSPDLLILNAKCSQTNTQKLNSRTRRVRAAGPGTVSDRRQANTVSGTPFVSVL